MIFQYLDNLHCSFLLQLFTSFNKKAINKENYTTQYFPKNVTNATSKNGYHVEFENNKMIIKQNKQIHEKYREGKTSEQLTNKLIYKLRSLRGAFNSVHTQFIFKDAKLHSSILLKIH